MDRGDRMDRMDRMDRGDEWLYLSLVLISMCQGMLTD